MTKDRSECVQREVCGWVQIRTVGNVLQERCVGVTEDSNVCVLQQVCGWCS